MEKRRREMIRKRQRKWLNVCAENSSVNNWPVFKSWNRSVRVCVNISFWTYSWSFICPLWSNRSSIVEECVFNQSRAHNADHLYANEGSSHCIRKKRTACWSVPQWDRVWPTRELNRVTEVCMCATGSDCGVSNWWPQMEVIQSRLWFQYSLPDSF